jgi:hydrogenase maturation protein HypF
VASKFHHAVVNASMEMIHKMKQETGLQKVVLSGGTFQNKYLFESLYRKLVGNKFTVISHSKVPCNDGGLALGQLAIAGRRM